MTLNFSNVDRRLAAVNLEGDEATIDLSGVDFIDPFAVIYLGMFIRHHSSKGKRLLLIGPEEVALRYLGRQNFWRRFNFTDETIQRGDLARRYAHSTSFGDIFDIHRSTTVADEVAQQALALLRRSAIAIDREALVEAIAELVDNFAIHAELEVGSCMMQYFPREGSVSFVIGDCGVGIRQTLAYNPKWAHLLQKPHREAVIKAFDPLVSRRPEGGTGLTLVAESVERLNGRLVLTSGDAWVRIERGQRKAGSQALDLPGVQVEISF